MLTQERQAQTPGITPRPSRSVRAGRGKRTSLAAGLSNWKSLDMDSDDDSETDSSDVKDTTFEPIKKLRRVCSAKKEDDFESEESSISAVSSSRGSPSPFLSTEEELVPQPWEMEYYPRTYTAFKQLIHLLGPPPSDFDFIEDTLEINADKSKKPKLTSTKLSKIVKLRMPKPRRFPLINNKNASYDPTKTGFMKLPGELRNRVYSLVLVNERQVNFRKRTGFSHTSAILRVNKDIYQEARTFLYSKNRFVFDQCYEKCGNYWQENWTELNYTHVRQFFTDIGPYNISLLRDVGLTLSDATCAGQRNKCVDQRRFERNKDLFWILRQLGEHGQLEKLKLGFMGSRLTRPEKHGDGDFMWVLAGVKTDRLLFGDPTLGDAANFLNLGSLPVEWKDILEGVMTRPVPLAEMDPRMKLWPLNVLGQT